MRSLDDIEKYLGPSLQRHVGCDLIDLFPGAGVWSQKLRDIVQPRRHVLMEPDEALYAPFLAPLAAQPNTTVLAQSGLVWTDLNSVLESLPDQTPTPTLDPSSSPPPPASRNDTLLVTANLAAYPRTRMTALYLFQLISAIRARTLFQRYGLVRMLLWVRPEDIRPTVLPTAVHQRGRSAIEAELACEWVHEVVGPDGQDPAVQASIYSSKKAGGPRDRAIELASARRVLAALGERGVQIPAGRETRLVREARGLEGAGDAAAEAALDERMLAPKLDTPYAAELRKLERDFEAGDFEKGSDEHKRLKTLRYRENSDTKQAREYVELLADYAELRRMHASGCPETEIRAAEESWNEKVSGLNGHSLSNFRLLRDNLHLFRQEPPAMHWDRRTLEPLVARGDEFFPNVACSLLDVQPRAVDPLLASDREGGRVLDVLLKVMLRNSRVPAAERLDDVWTDAAEGILAGCPALRDPARGGSAVGGVGAVAVRALNEGQWREIVRAWLGWHFRPGLDTLRRQHAEEEEEDDDEDGPGSQGSNDFLL